MRACACAQCCVQAAVASDNLKVRVPFTGYSPNGVSSPSEYTQTRGVRSSMTFVTSRAALSLFLRVCVLRATFCSGQRYFHENAPLLDGSRGSVAARSNKYVPCSLHGNVAPGMIAWQYTKVSCVNKTPTCRTTRVEARGIKVCDDRSPLMMW